MDYLSQESMLDILAKRQKPISALSFLSGKDKVLIYGAGNIGKELLRVLIRKGVSVRGFLDGKLDEGTRVAGFEVLRPDTNLLTRDQKGDCCVIIAIFNADVEIPPVQRYLAGCGFGTVVTFLDIYRHLPQEFGDRLWLTNQKFYDGCGPFLDEAHSLWKDEESKTIFKEIVNFRCTFNYASLPKRSEGPQYFDPSIPSINSSRFIDCGAYDGDTLLALYSSGTDIEAIAAFEPDPDNFMALSNKVINIESIKQTILFPCGVWSHTVKISFSGAKGVSSSISEAGDTIIQCVAIDEILGGFRPTYIKMDIEGAEFDALLGAKKTIRANRPALAVCLYHRPEHLWQIPLLLNSWDLGYLFYLRVYKYLGQELVMYAIPVSRS